MVIAREIIIRANHTQIIIIKNIITTVIVETIINTINLIHTVITLIIQAHQEAVPLSGKDLQGNPPLPNLHIITNLIIIINHILQPRETDTIKNIVIQAHQETILRNRVHQEAIHLIVLHLQEGLVFPHLHHQNQAVVVQ